MDPEHTFVNGSNEEIELNEDTAYRITYTQVRRVVGIDEEGQRQDYIEFIHTVDVI